jgi:hypothetical protein
LRILIAGKAFSRYTCAGRYIGGNTVTRQTSFCTGDQAKLTYRYVWKLFTAMGQVFSLICGFTRIFRQIQAPKALAIGQ